MQNGLKQILIVEDEFMLTQLYSIALEDLGFNETQQMVYELGNIVVQFASTKDEAQHIARTTALDVVFLDHTLFKGTSEAVVPDIFRTSPDSAVYLASSDIGKQTDAVTKALNDAGMPSFVAKLKEHTKSDTKGFIRIMNDMIRPSAAAPDIKPSEPSV